MAQMPKRFDHDRLIDAADVVALIDRLESRAAEARQKGSHGLATDLEHAAQILNRTVAQAVRYWDQVLATRDTG
jgi:hypothetical protein